LSFRNASALYVFALIFLIFSIWIPNTFLTMTTWRTLLDNEAITAIVAVGLVAPLAAGVFDLSVGAALGAGSMLASWLLVNEGVPVGLAVAITIAGGVLIGLLNGLLYVRGRIDSFIATLGMSSVLTAFVLWVSGGQQIIGLSTGFQQIAGRQILGVTLPVYFVLLLSLVAWYVLERTPAGRRVYATGSNPEAARLAGVRTDKVILVSLISCSVMATFGGLLLASRLGTGDPTEGPDYLLPAFSAAFLGSTQFRSGRFNVWGTVVSVYVLAVGVKGLQLAGAASWVPFLFNGLALLLAVGLAKRQGATGTGVWSRIRRREAPPSAEATGAA